MKIKINNTGVLAAALLLCTSTSNADTELSLLIDNGSESFAIATALTEAYSKENPDVSFDIEIRPGGSDGDNLVKTRLFTEEMTDIFLYDSGALLQALKPSRTLEPIEKIENFKNIKPAYIPSVSDGDHSFGVPVRAAMGGGIFYNRKVYNELGLAVPKTWDEFLSNALKIKQHTDVIPVVQTYKDAWTSQLPILSDYYNVQQGAPDFAENYTKNLDGFYKNKYARSGFEKIEQMYSLGLFNKYPSATTYNEGIRLLAEGKAAHYPMLTFALSTIRLNYPEHLNNVGFFAQPGESSDKNGLTLWMPAAYYISKSSENKDESKKFLNFVASAPSCDIITKAAGATGPYLLNGCGLPEDIPQALKDMTPYFDEPGRLAPALEFLSPIKGPALQQLAVEVGTGSRSGIDAARLYDKDVEKQAKQLGLDNW